MLFHIVVTKKEKAEKIQTFHLSYFLRDFLFGFDGLRNIIVFQSTFNKTDSKQQK